MPRWTITTNDRVRIMTLREEGLFTRDVARREHWSQSDVVRTWNRFQLTVSVEVIHRKGRPRSTGAQDDRYLQLLSRRYRGLSAPDLTSAFEGATGGHISHETVRKLL